MIKTKQKHIINKFIKEGLEYLNTTKKKNNFETDNSEAELLLNNIKLYPHLFFLGCIMQRRIKAGKAWLIPYKIGKKIGGFKFKKFLALDINQLAEIFRISKEIKPRIKEPEKIIYSAIQDIHKKYRDDISKLWAGNLKSATIVRRFLEFNGVGVKIATMATNILARDFKVKMQDYSSIDISPDVQVRKCFIKNEFLRKDASNEELIYLAREIYPKYPGILDLPAWKCGRKIKTKSNDTDF